MIDIQFIRDNPEVVKTKAKQKLIEVDVDRLLSLDNSRRNLLAKIDDLRQKRNVLSDQFKQSKPSAEQIQQGKELKDQISKLDTEYDTINAEFETLLKQVPNMPLDDVPVGASEDENVVSREWGEKPTFEGFEPKTHWEIAEARGLIDKERGAKVAGARFAYIKGGLVELQFAIMQWVIQLLGDPIVLEQLVDENSLKIPTKPFTPVLPPSMIRTEVYDAMDRLEPRDDRYKVGGDDDDLWLQGSAEHTLGSMYKDEILDAKDFPIRYVGFLTSFRREAGTYGKDMEGIWRMHQFDKLEMEVFSLPEHGLEEHKLLVAIQEYFMQLLGIPYRVLQKCTADIGKPNARGIDIEAWLPGRGKYGETHTADYMTDYQSRRLKTRVRKDDGSVVLVYTNDATAFALGRLMVAIIENFQQKDGTIKIPDVLQPYMNGKSVI